jgi:DUF917 family protein
MHQVERDLVRPASSQGKGALTTMGAVELTLADLPALASGCAVLGAGGGGDTHVGRLFAEQAIEEHGPVPVVDLDDLPDDGLVMPCGLIGAPTIALEKIGSGDEGRLLQELVQREWDRPVVGLMSAEIGGVNGMLPVGWAARLGLPLVDADGMGRAFPELQQVVMELAGVPAAPCMLADERGSTLVIRTPSARWVERLARTVTVELGGKAVFSHYQMTVAQARTATLRGSVSRALGIGRRMRAAEGGRLALLAAELDAVTLLEGKVVEVERRTTGGFVRGAAVIEGLLADRGRVLRLELQNEHLVALEDGQVLASVPDPIAVLDHQTGAAISTERLRYGQRVSVIALPCPAVWRSPKGLAVAGPRAFGYEFDYVPVERLQGPAGMRG